MRSTARTMQSPNPLPMQQSPFSNFQLWIPLAAVRTSGTAPVCCGLPAADRVHEVHTAAREVTGESRDGVRPSCVHSSTSKREHQRLFQSIDESLKQTPVANVPTFGRYLGVHSWTTVALAALWTMGWPLSAITVALVATLTVNCHAAGMNTQCVATHHIAIWTRALA
jgi:hypothetical protein